MVKKARPLARSFAGWLSGQLYRQFDKLDTMFQTLGHGNKMGHRGERYKVQGRRHASKAKISTHRLKLDSERMMIRTYLEILILSSIRVSLREYEEDSHNSTVDKPSMNSQH